MIIALAILSALLAGIVIGALVTTATIDRVIARMSTDELRALAERVRRRKV